MIWLRSRETWLRCGAMSLYSFLGRTARSRFSIVSCGCLDALMRDPPWRCLNVLRREGGTLGGGFESAGGDSNSRQYTRRLIQRCTHPRTYLLCGATEALSSDL